MGTANCQSTGKRCACRRPAGRNVLRAEAFRRPRPSRHRYRPQGAEQQPRVRAADTPRRTSLSRGAHRKGRMAECCTVTLASGPDQDVDRPADYLLSSRILHRHDHADAGRLRVSERPSVQRERGANQDGFGTVTDVMPVVHTTGAPGGNRGGGGLSTSGARCDAYGERERALCKKSTDGASCPSLTSQSPTWCSKVRSANFGGPRRKPQEGSAHRAAVDWRLCSAPITSGLQPHRLRRCMLSNEQGTDAATSMWVITSCGSVVCSHRLGITAHSPKHQDVNEYLIETNTMASFFRSRTASGTLSSSASDKAKAA